MATNGRGKVGEGFGPDAKRGRVEFVCEMYGGGKSLREAWPLPWSFFFSFFSFLFFVIKSLLGLKVQKTHAALAMEIKNL